MANYTYNSDLVDDVLFRCGEPTDGSSDFQDAAVRYLNRTYQAIWRGGGALVPGVQVDWWWLRKYGSGQLTLYPVYDTGSISVTNGSTSATLSTTPQRSGVNFTLRSGYLQIDGHPDIFFVFAHTSGTTDVTLDSIYTGPTDTAATFKVMFFEYNILDEVMTLLSPMRAYQADRVVIEGISADNMWQKWPMHDAGSGVPHNFADVGINSGGHRMVRFSHYGGTSDDELIRVDYEYLVRPTSDIADDSNEIDMPREWRYVLADWATYFLLLDKEDSRVADVLRLATAGISAMIQADVKERQRMGSVSTGLRAGSTGKLYPRTGDRSDVRNGGLRTASGHRIY